MVKAKSQFKKRSTANNVEIIVPVPSDADGAKFKTSTGYCKYVPEKNCVIWHMLARLNLIIMKWIIFVQMIVSLCICASLWYEYVITYDINAQ